MEKKKLIFFVYLLLHFFSTSAQSAINDIFPGDYYPGVPGTSALTLYSYQRSQSGSYKIDNGFKNEYDVALRYQVKL